MTGSGARVGALLWALGLLAAGCGSAGASRPATSETVASAGERPAPADRERGVVPPASGPVREAERLLARGEVEGARELLRERVAAEPGDARAWYQLGFAAEELGEAEEAEEAYRRAVAAEPAFALAWTNLGRLLLERGRLEPALQALRRAVEAAPGLPEAWANLGLAAREAGREQEALGALRRAVELRPSDAASRVELGLLALQLGERALALEQLRAALPLALRRGEPALLLAVGNGLRRLGEARAALRAMEAAVEARRRDRGEATAALLAELALARRATGDRDGARAALRAALRLRPDYATAYFLLAALAAEEDRRAEAEEHLRACLRSGGEPAVLARCEALRRRLQGGR